LARDRGMEAGWEIGKFNFGLEMFDVSLEGEFTVSPDTYVFVVVHIF
jgi:hypothetical protein